MTIRCTTDLDSNCTTTAPTQPSHQAFHRDRQTVRVAMTPKWRLWHYPEQILSWPNLDFRADAMDHADECSSIILLLWKFVGTHYSKENCSNAVKHSRLGKYDVIQTLTYDE